jgi:inosine-uridine nucleoside N-ribohydrolase
MDNRRYQSLFLLVLLAVLFPVLALAKIPVIIDTDIGDDIDDTWAVVLALRSPELDVKLVLSDYGKPDYRGRLLAKLLETAGRSDIPIGLGVEVDKGQKLRQGKWVENYRLADYPGKIYSDGVSAMIDVIQKSRGKITLIAIGPTPNLAEALKRAPEIARKVRFVGMHGSVRVGYGGAREPHAEWNVKADIASCQKVFTAAWPMTITPLDTCGLVQLKGDKYEAIRNSDDKLIRALMENYDIWDGFEQPGGVPRNSAVQSSTLFDCVAVYLAIADRLCEMENVRLVVDDKGFTREDPKGKKVRAAMRWKDLPAFEDWLVRRYTAQPARQ